MSTVLKICYTNNEHLHFWDKNFTELYTVYGLIKSIDIPLMFCFLLDKTLKTYIELLKKNECSWNKPK